MYLDKTYFIGFTSKITRPELIDTPPVPINYKDPIKIQERVDASLERIKPLAEVCPGIATVEEIHVFDYDGTNRFWAGREFGAWPNNPLGPPAVCFWRWLHQKEQLRGRNGPTYAVVPEEAVNMGPAFFGFRIKAFFSMIALEAIHWNHAVVDPPVVTNKVKIPVQIWHDNIGVVDPYKILFNDEQRKLIPLDKAIQLLFDTALDLESLYQDPRKQAILAHRMTVRGQLLGTAPEEFIGYSYDHNRTQEDTASWSSREEGTSSGAEPGVLPAKVHAGTVSRSLGGGV